MDRSAQDGEGELPIGLIISQKSLPQTDPRRALAARGRRLPTGGDKTGFYTDFCAGLGERGIGGHNGRALGCGHRNVEFEPGTPLAIFAGSPPELPVHDMAGVRLDYQPDPLAGLESKLLAGAGRQMHLEARSGIHHGHHGDALLLQGLDSSGDRVASA